MRTILPLIPVLCLIGCGATASFTQTGPSYPAYDGTVRVYFEPPQGVEYEEIGIVSSRGDTNHDEADLIGALQERAAQHGANGIIVTKNEARRGVIVSSTLGTTYTTLRMTAIAIRVIDSVSE